MNRTVERFTFNSGCLYQSKLVFVLYKNTEFDVEFYFSFRASGFFSRKNAFLPKKLNFWSVYFF